MSSLSSLSNSYMSLISSLKCSQFTCNPLSLNSDSSSRCLINSIARIIAERYFLFQSTTLFDDSLSSSSIWEFVSLQQEIKLFSFSNESVWHCNNACFLKSSLASSQFWYGCAISDFFHLQGFVPTILVKFKKKIKRFFWWKKFN